MKTLIVVPARLGSTRFPGKPLHLIAGKTLLARVAQIAKVAAKRTGADYVVAVDSEEVSNHCRELDLPYVMTAPELPSGTDRALAAALAMGQAYDFVLNLQGDAPFTPVAHVERLIVAAQSGIAADVFTPVIQLDWEALDVLRAHKQEQPFSGTTCVRDAAGRAFWFSKNILPAIRKEEVLREKSLLSPVFRHIGLYGYTMAALKNFTSSGVGHYETLEGLEQLRFLENGFAIHAELVDAPKLSMSGVDTPADAVMAEKLIGELGDPYEELEALL
ncbi:3-deoxy-manno-octulosonate cytidylyltransferase [Polycladidibacter stylochi]|uniref:3-deoxy-manno-octulosonate cytidylyltransferase n=1 Tax=Polycladidibacter stylochi TaxID=1807766 RepID=UPI00082C3975|nr:manno-octulosonate cytidylyltransferase [Pseudovibrio stylochi]